MKNGENQLQVDVFAALRCRNVRHAKELVSSFKKCPLNRSQDFKPLFGRYKYK